ncbi:MAG TPA: AI-2E family transporter [Armatimonadota bacterium]|nr:AI-2E family transporter [Armatimonadota bacterium]
MFLMVWGIIWRLTAIGLAIYATWRVRFILVLVLLSVILTFVVDPLVERACRLRPRWIPRSTWRSTATLTVFVTLILLGIITSLWLWHPFQSQIIDLQHSIGGYQQVLQTRAKVLQGWYMRLPVQMRDALAGEPIAGVTNYLFTFLRKVLASTVGWFSHIWELILIPVLSFYFCLDSRSLKRELLMLIPYHRTRETLYILRRSSRIMQDYIVAQILLCFISGLVVGIGLWLLHVPYPLVLGVLAGITRAVPIVGPVVGAIPITLLAMTVSVKMGLSVLVFFSFMHLFESKVLLPELIGHSVRLHPSIILIVLLVGSEFFGILGMFLAAPVAAIGRVLLNLYVVEPEMRRRKGLAPSPYRELQDLSAKPVDRLP